MHGQAPEKSEKNLRRGEARPGGTRRSRKQERKAKRGAQVKPTKAGSK